jgi:putative ABC transport system permease protein
MFKNVLLIFFRNLSKKKSYYSINIIGLSISLGTALAIILYVSHELSYDQYHTKKNRIYRVIQGGESDEQSSSVPFPTGPSLLNDYPDIIEEATRLFNFQASSLGIVVEENGEKKVFNEPRLFFADSAYFRIFTHQFIVGNANECLTGPGRIVVTEKMANKLFRTTDVIGKTVKFEGKYDMIITAVIKDVPDNSHFKFDYLASFSSLQTIFEKGIPEKNWYWNPVWTYILIKEGKSSGELQPQLGFFVRKYFHPSLIETVTLVLQPLTDIYLKTRSEYEIGPMSDIKYSYIFISIGAFMLIVASINFINLSTAQASDRFKEIGVRKILGANRKNIVAQFLGETFSISLISGVFGVLLVVLFLPWINTFSGKEFFIPDIFRPEFLFSVLAVSILSALLSGIYPALMLSALLPVKILKGNKIAGKSTLRQLLVTLQLTVSIVLIICTLLIENQIQFLKNSDLGFHKDQIIAIPVQRTKLVEKYHLFKERILQNKDIDFVSTGNTIVGKDFQASNYKVEGKEEKLYPCLFVRNDFLKTLGIPVIGGKDFSDSVVSKGYRGIINRAFLEEAGWQTPEEAIGRIIEGTLEGPIPIVGVCENFNFAPLKQESGPIMLIQTDFVNYKDFFTRYVYVRVNANNLQTVVDFLKVTWKDFAEDNPFEYVFLDQEIGRLYSREEKFSTLGRAFAIIAISIGCLGLWGLSSYYVYKRRKEIGIRKTLGAQFSNLLVTLSSDFFKPVLLSSLIGVCLSYYFITMWLENFAFKTVVSYTIFVIGCCVITVTSFTVILIQLTRAAKINPAAVLRQD